MELKTQINIPRVQIAVASIKHAKILASIMRQADKDEVFAATGRSPKSVLIEAIRASHVAYAFYVQKELAALFGVVKATSQQAGGEFGIPWVLTSYAVEKDVKGFWRCSKLGLEIFLKEYRLLANMVDARHTSSIRWLRHLGAKIDEQPKPHGKFKLPFYRFVFERSA